MTKGKVRRALLFLILGILVLSFMVVLFYVFIYRGISSAGLPGPLLVNITKIENIPNEVNQGEVVLLRVNLKNDYRDYTVDCTGDLDLRTSGECVSPDCYKYTCLQTKVEGEGKTAQHVAKTIRLEPGEEKELNYTIHIPDCGKKLDFDIKIYGPLIVTCRGPCSKFRRPRCLPFGALRSIWLNATIKGN